MKLDGIKGKVKNGSLEFYFFAATLILYCIVCMDHQGSFQKDVDGLSIRSETSYSEIGLTKKRSIDSI